MYIVKISHDELIGLLNNHYDQNIFSNIKEGDTIETIEVNYREIIITIGEED